MSECLVRKRPSSCLSDPVPKKRFPFDTSAPADIWDFGGCHSAPPVLEIPRSCPVVSECEDNTRSSTPYVWRGLSSSVGESRGTVDVGAVDEYEDEEPDLPEPSLPARLPPEDCSDVGSLDDGSPPMVVGRGICGSDFSNNPREWDRSASPDRLFYLPQHGDYDQEEAVPKVLQRLHRLQRDLLDDWNRHSREVEHFQRGMCNLFHSRDRVLHRLHAVLMETRCLFSQSSTSLGVFPSESSYMTGGSPVQPSANLDFWPPTTAMLSPEKCDQPQYFHSSPKLPTEAWSSAQEPAFEPQSPHSATNSFAWEEPGHKEDGKSALSESRPLWPFVSTPDTDAAMKEDGACDKSRYTSLDSPPERWFSDPFHKNCEESEEAEDQCAEESISLCDKANGVSSQTLVNATSSDTSEADDDNRGEMVQEVAWLQDSQRAQWTLSSSEVHWAAASQDQTTSLKSLGPDRVDQVAEIT